MEGDVDEAIAFGLAAIGFDALAQRLPLVLQTERHDEGVAAHRRRARAGLERIGHDDARRPHLFEMDVAVDAARHDQQVRCVDGVVRSREPVGQGGDAPILDADVTAERI